MADRFAAAASPPTVHCRWRTTGRCPSTEFGDAGTEIPSSPDVHSSVSRASATSTMNAGSPVEHASSVAPALMQQDPRGRRHQYTCGDLGARHTEDSATPDDRHRESSGIARNSRWIARHPSAARRASVRDIRASITLSRR